MSPACVSLHDLLTLPHPRTLHTISGWLSCSKYHTSITNNGSWTLMALDSGLLPPQHRDEQLAPYARRPNVAARRTLAFSIDWPLAVCLRRAPDIRDAASHCALHTIKRCRFGKVDHKAVSEIPDRPLLCADPEQPLKPLTPVPPRSVLSIYSKDQLSCMANLHSRAYLLYGGADSTLQRGATAPLSQ